ncbi:uncharacterized protein LACBIDRAFT_309546 [Laccaria bicolor S238N-H82]|uniref:Predicted protein n=1 Tax=Laccaria bicolor (strain S238N-H82 / ATCC MYA-4686) TaxID=486041 RepID=B0DSK1_LACBS|nr:uncharacterized protein LACBIDRAFT_309546 [Laccaria bicolor S238N-H82]EDR02563.1 predicted protein [Laccaria bicolor S238N-H82]|eukprot:XP_001886926.1 predicted protein [Laccaria bicolor S238N-H82]
MLRPVSGHGTTYTNRISKTRCANGSAKHCNIELDRTQIYLYRILSIKRHLTRTPGNSRKGLIPKIGFLSGRLCTKFVRTGPGLPHPNLKNLSGQPDQGKFFSTNVPQLCPNTGWEAFFLTSRRFCPDSGRILSLFVRIGPQL